MASASAPASWPAWVPVLTSFLGDEQQYGSVSQINLFLPNLLLGHDVCAGIETLTKTPSYNGGQPRAMAVALLAWGAFWCLWPVTNKGISCMRYWDSPFRSHVFWENHCPPMQSSCGTIKSFIDLCPPIWGPFPTMLSLCLSFLPCELRHLSTVFLCALRFARFMSYGRA